MKTLLFVVIGFVFVACDPFLEIFGDDPEGKNVGGSGDQEARCAVQTDNGYIIAGFDSTTANGLDVYLVKFKKNGKRSWQKRYGGPGSQYGRWIEKLSDGNLIVCGSTDSYSGDNDVYLLKINGSGDTLWTRHLSLGSSESGYCVREETGGNLLIIGNRGKDMLLVKTDANGQLLWYKTYGGSDEDQGECMLINPAGEYILLGETKSYGLSKSDFFIVKTDVNGNEIWNRHYGGSGYNHGFSIDFALDSGYILAGTTHENSTSSGKATFIRILDNGDTLWTRKYNDRAANTKSVCRSADGNYVFTGWQGGLFKSAYLTKMKPSGEIIWNRTYSGEFLAFTESKGYHVIPTSDKGFLMTGFIQIEKKGYDMMIIKTNSKGQSSW